MKLSNRQPEREIEELSLTSMIDVVFLLLIFFVTTASFVRTEREMYSNIEFQNSSSANVNNDLERASVIVEATAEGPRYTVGYRTFTSPSELETFLTDHFQRAAPGAYVYVSEGVPFRWAAAAIHACESANLGSVAYVPR